MHLEFQKHVLHIPVVPAEESLLRGGLGVLTSVSQSLILVLMIVLFLQHVCVFLSYPFWPQQVWCWGIMLVSSEEEETPYYSMKTIDNILGLDLYVNKFIDLLLATLR